MTATRPPVSRIWLSSGGSCVYCQQDVFVYHLADLLVVDGRLASAKYRYVGYFRYVFDPAAV